MKTIAEECSKLLAKGLDNIKVTEGGRVGPYREDITNNNYDEDQNRFHFLARMRRSLEKRNADKGRS
jgi:hypothetical protein